MIHEDGYCDDCGCELHEQPTRLLPDGKLVCADCGGLVLAGRQTELLPRTADHG